MKLCFKFLSLLLLIAGCGSEDKDSLIGSQPVLDVSWGKVQASYGIIDTIAGLGTIYAKGENGWQSSFENGPAIEAELSRPHMAHVGTHGITYIADKDAHAIRAVKTDGTISTIAGTGIPGDDGDDSQMAVESRLSEPNGLWLNSSNDAIYVLDLGSNKIRKIQDGIMTTLIEIPGLSVGRGLWVADDEKLAYISSGSILYKWSEADGVSVMASGFSSLGNLALAPDGKLYVTDRGGHRVYKIDDNGSKTAVAGTGTISGAGDGASALELGLDEVRGIVFHPEGGYFLATHKGGQIWYVDFENTAHLFVDGDSDDTHTGDGKNYLDPSVRISEPRGISLAPNGDLIITENDAGFIRVVKSVDPS